MENLFSWGNCGVCVGSTADDNLPRNNIFKCLLLLFQYVTFDEKI